MKTKILGVTFVVAVAVVAAFNVNLNYHKGKISTLQLTNTEVIANAESVNKYLTVTHKTGEYTNPDGTKVTVNTIVCEGDGTLDCS